MNTTTQTRTSAPLTIFFCILFILLGVISVYVGIQNYGALSYEKTEDIVQFADTYAIVATIQSVFYLLVILGFCFWVYGAYEDLPSLGAKNLKYTPGRVVRSFFIPIVNFIHPYTAMQEIWRESDPKENSANSLRVRAWWFSLWASVVFAAAVSIADMMMEYSDLQLQIVAGFPVISDIFAIVCALTVILIISGVEKMQNKKYQCLSESDKPNDTEVGSP